MTNKAIKQIAQFIRQRNQVEADIARLTGRPAQVGFVGEYIAANIFDIQFENQSARKSSDGRFRAGPLSGKTVSIKWYGRQDYILDISANAVADYYLVMTGPLSGENVSKASTRMWSVDLLYLFDAKEMVRQLTVRKSNMGLATAIPKKWWESAEIYPSVNSKLMSLSPAQVEMIAMFSSAALHKKS